jgi:hypothetical protein
VGLEAVAAIVAYVVLAVGVVSLVGILVLLARVTIVRALLARFRYDVYSFMGREPGDGISVTYQEGPHRLEFFGSREERSIPVPGAASWAQIMPPWVTMRRDEILTRLRRHADRRRVTLRDAAAPSEVTVLWFETLVDGQSRVHRIE